MLITDHDLFSRSQIRKLLIPLIAEISLSYLVGLLDSVMVAHAGEAAVSAVSLVDSISVLMINIFSALASGGSVVVGQYIGRKSQEKADTTAKLLLWVLAVISILITGILFIGKNLLITTLFGSADTSVLENCDIYYGIVIFSIPFIAIYNGGAALFRVTGNSRIPMLVSLLMNVINLAGNALLIYGFNMGIAGVAIPTLISRGVAMMVIFILLTGKTFPLHLGNILRVAWVPQIIKNIFAIGVPNGIENGMFQFGKIILLSLVSTLSTASITANAIGNTVGSLHCVIGMAGNQAMITVVSQCVGARDYSQARRFTKYFVILVYVLQGIVCMLMIAAIPIICRLYHVTDETAGLASQIMLIHAAGSIILWPLSFMLNTSMRAAGDSRFPMVISSLSMWLCRVCGGYIAIKILGLGVTSIWYAWLIDWLFRMVFFIPRWHGHRWETKAVK